MNNDAREKRHISLKAARNLKQYESISVLSSRCFKLLISNGLLLTVQKVCQRGMYHPDMTKTLCKHVDSSARAALNCLPNAQETDCKLNE